VIGIALEQRTGLGYDQLLRTRILDQLRMDDRGISISPSQWERRAHPHAADLSASPEFNKPWSISTLQSTANDLLTFLAAAAGVVPSPLTPAFDAMLTTRRPAPMLGHGVEQAVGWYVRPLASGRLVGHSGSGGGFGASALYDPATRTGVAILSNAESIWEDVAVHALRPSIPMNRKQTGVTLSNAAMDALTGRYVDSTGAAWIVVREAAGLLLLHPQGYKVPLTPESEQHFSVQGFPTLTIDFEKKDVAGTIATLTWTLGQASTSARKIAGSTR
jgi:hypothetical protein